MTGTALITGASSGIGLEFAKIFASNGVGLVLTARNHKKLYELKDELEKNYRIPISVIATDLSKPDAPGDLFEQVSREGFDISYLINNAGLGDYGEFINSDWVKTEMLIDLNMKALTQLTRLFLPSMQANSRGMILNVASVAGFMPGPLLAVYYASKAYVISFSEALAKELEGTGISVTVLCPGATQSGFQESAGMGQSRLVKYMPLASAEVVAEYGFRAMIRGKTVAIQGIVNRCLAWSIRFIPRELVTIISKFTADRV